MCPTQHKLKYESRKDALIALRRINTRTGRKLKTVYPCGDHWHITRDVEQKTIEGRYRHA